MRTFRKGNLEVEEGSIPLHQQNRTQSHKRTSSIPRAINIGKAASLPKPKTQRATKSGLPEDRNPQLTLTNRAKQNRSFLPNVLSLLSP